MTASAPAQRSFSAGEISPFLWGRTDYQRHQTGLRACRGFIPLRHGGLTRAPGTRHLGRTRADAPARLIPFAFGVNDAVTLEFSNLRLRVWREGALVLDGGDPFELITPYDWAAVQRLTYVQTADVIYLADGVLPPQKLSRLALDDWTIGPMVPRGGPLRVPNADQALTVQASAATGTVTLTASAPLFQTGHVGGLFQLRVVNWTTPIWAGNQTVALSDLRRFDGQVYEVTVLGDGNSGVTPPQHRRGSQVVQAGGPTWTWRGTDAGLVRITARASATSATAQVLRPIPAEIVAAGTWDWAEGAWSDRCGQPAAVALYDQRLVFAATAAEPRTIWFSTVGDFEDFETGDPDQAIAYAIDAARGVNRIVWLSPGPRGLHVGAEGEVHSSRSTQAGEVITARNAAFALDALIGCAPTEPIAPDGRPIFIARERARVFQLDYRLERDAITPLELSLPAEHLGAGGFARLAWQSAPLRIAWITRDDGLLTAMIHDPEEDVLGWCTIPVADGAVESVAVTPGPDGADRVTLVVRREWDGVTRRFVEQLSDVWGQLRDDGAIWRAEHLYCGVRLTLDPAADVLTGLDHLEGREVLVWTPRGQVGPLTVTGGSVALPRPTQRAFVGLHDDTALAGLLPFFVPARDGDALGRPVKIKRAGMRLHRTAAVRVRTVAAEFGRPAAVGDWQTVSGAQTPGDLTQVFDGVRSVQGLGQGWTPDVMLDISPVGAAPLTLLAVTPELEARS